LELGADVDIGADVCNSPVTCAADNGHAEVVKYLIKKGARLAATRPERDPLLGAILSGNIEIMKCLIDAGADPSVVYRGANGRLKNALSFAEERGQAEVVSYLTQIGCRRPIEGVDEPVGGPTEVWKNSNATGGAGPVVEYLTELFGPVKPLSLQEVVPPSDQVRVEVGVIRPTEDSPVVTVFTTGMSDRAMNVPPGQEEYQYAELVMHLPPDWPDPSTAGSPESVLWPLHWLRKVAYYPHLYGTWLGGRWTIISSDEPPVPLGPGTQQTCLMLLADFGETLPLELPDGRTIRFYTVNTLFTAERDFEKQHGMVALLQRLHDKGETAVVDVGRSSVV
jgi:hypothetical protein